MGSKMGNESKENVLSAAGEPAQDVMEISAVDLEELELYLDVLDGLLESADAVDSHIAEVAGNIFQKIAALGSLPESWRARVVLTIDVLESAVAGTMSLEEGRAAAIETYSSMKTSVRAAMKLRNDDEEDEGGDLDEELAAEPEGESLDYVATAIRVPKRKLPIVVIDKDNPEFLDFITESQEAISTAQTALLALEKEPGSRGHVDEVFRCFHNIKGISGFLDLHDVKELAHAAEGFLDRVRRGAIRLEGDYSKLAFDALDMLSEMVSRVQKALGGMEYESPARFLSMVQQLGRVEAAARRARPVAEMDVEVAQEAEVAGDGAAPGVAARTDTFVKVNTTRLDHLVDLVGELVISNAMVRQVPEVSNTKNPELTRNMSQLGKITRELQELSMRMRMVSLRGLFQKMARLARDLGLKCDKTLDFSFSGEDTELDRNVVEEIMNPLVHMVRNSVDHGIERREERLRLGKPEKGRVHLSAWHEGGSVMIRIEDDGRGLDREAILAKARATGLLRPEETPTDREIYRLVFHAGFSTAKTVTDVSGRGVGMDVVRRSIENLRGRVDVDSTPDRGSMFTIRMPLTLAIIDGMVVRVGSEKYIVPTTSIQESVRPREDQLTTVVGKGEMMALRGEMYPLHRLHRLFRVSGAKEEPLDALMLIVGEEGGRYALMVDDLIGQQQVVIKSLGSSFDSNAGVSGGAIMGDGRVALILDTSGVAKMASLAD